MAALLKIEIIGAPILRQKCIEVEKFDDELRALAKDMHATMLDANGIGLAAPQVGHNLRLALVDLKLMLEVEQNEQDQAENDQEEVENDEVEEQLFTRIVMDGSEISSAQAMPLFFCNPRVETSGSFAIQEEGCLSIPRIRAKVRRSNSVTLRFQDLYGKKHSLETDALFARAILHEYDHLNGILFIDRVSSAAKIRIRSKIKKMLRE